MGLRSPNVLLAGASGLVGGLVLRHLLEDLHYAGVVFAPSRRPLEDASDKRLVTILTDFKPPASDAAIAASIEAHPPGNVHAFISCLGTTIKSAGSREAFIAVDRELVLRLAQLAFDHGARHGLLVSSVGASRQSGNFYLRIKGEVEDALKKIGFERVDILQPGLLLGEREQRRPGEALAQMLAPLADPALLGKLRRYRSIDADTVARALVRLLEFPDAGVFTHQHDAILSFGGEY